MPRPDRRRKDNPRFTPPEPKNVRHEVADLVRLALDVKDEYQWAYKAAYAPTIVGSDPDETTEDKRKIVVGRRRAFGEIDPTMELTEHPKAAHTHPKAQARSDLSRAVEALRDGMGRLRAAKDAILDALEKCDVPRKANVSQLYPRVVKKSEVTQSREAQDRRHGRGEGFGES